MSGADAGAISGSASAVVDFWLTHYLDSYIAHGGSKIKFLTGGSCCCAVRCLETFLRESARRGYKAVSLSAKTTWVHDFKEIYTAALKGADLTDCLRKCAALVVRRMGYDPDAIPEGTRFADYLAQNGELDPITRREMRNQINGLFYKNPRMDRDFSVCAALLTGDLLGYPVLEPAAEALLADWLGCARGGPHATALRKLGLSGDKITKQNARHMLRSLIEVIKAAGFHGLVVGIDDLDILASASSLEEIRYTKMRREDSYESIRELIDEIDTLTNAMFVFTFDRRLLEDEVAGFKSYQALWMRVQNEVESARLNRFADIIDLDLPVPRTLRNAE